MIRHIVMLDLAAGAQASELAAVMDGLAALIDDIPGWTAFEHGPNRDFEGKSARYPYGFTCDFTDADALQRYAGDAGHQALGARLVGLCAGGAAGIMVIDLDTTAERSS